MLLSSRGSPPRSTVRPRPVRGSGLLLSSLAMRGRSAAPAAAPAVSLLCASRARRSMGLRVQFTLGREQSSTVEREDRGFGSVLNGSRRAYSTWLVGLSKAKEENLTP